MQFRALTLPSIQPALGQFSKMRVIPALPPCKDVEVKD